MSIPTDCYNQAAQATSAILKDWVSSLNEAELRKLSALRDKGVRCGTLMVLNGEGQVPTGTIVLVDSQGGTETAASIGFIDKRAMN